MPKYFLIKDPLITCTSCTSNIDGAIKPIKNTSFAYQLCHKKKALLLRVSADQAEKVKAEIREAAQGVGFFFDECLWEDSDENGLLDKDRLIEFEEKNIVSSHLKKGLSSILIGALWISLPFLPIANAFVLSIVILSLAVVGTLTIAYSGWEIFKRAFDAAKRKHLTMDTQFTVSVLVALLVSWVAFGLTGLSLLFDAALLILGFRHIGLAIEEWAKQKIDEGSRLLDGLPQTVMVILPDEEKNKTIQKAPKDLVKGDKIRILPGQSIPADGVCVSEHARLIAPDLSGQADVFAVQAGGKLLQGYKVVGSPVELIVEKPMSESTLATMQEQAQIAAQKRMDDVSAITLIGAHFVKGVFVIALCAFAFVAFYSIFMLGLPVGVSLTLALKTALGVLVASCPCVLGSIIPLIGMVGVYKCLRNGITLLDANVLQVTAKAKCIAFDFNGTLSTGIKTVNQVKFIADEKIDQKKILAYLKFLEEKSDHLVGQAIYAHLNSRYPQENLNDAEKAELNLVHYGAGVGMEVHGERLIVGNKNVLPKDILFNPQDFPVLAPMMQRNYIAYENKVIGYIDIAEHIRPEAYAVLQYFRGQGLEVKLLTGADKDTVWPYAEALGFDEKDIEADLSVKPDQKEHPKVTCIKTLQKKYGPTIFVGDAGNDSLPIATAEVGVLVDSPTMSEGNRAGANAYIGQRSLWPLVKMHTISNQTIFNIRLSLGFSLLYNLASFAFMGGLALFWLGMMINPGLGVAIMVGQALFILMFAAVFQAWPVPNKQEIPETKTSAVVHSYGSIPATHESSVTTDSQRVSKKQTDSRVLSSSRSRLLDNKPSMPVALIRDSTHQSLTVIP